MGRGALSGHLPVMYAQVLDGLNVRGNGTYLDGTFGRGGHARGVLERLGPGGRLLLMDKDPEAIRKELFAAGLPNLFIPGRDSFCQVEAIPLLGSGKLDLKAVKRLALERFAARVSK